MRHSKFIIFFFWRCNSKKYGSEVLKNQPEFKLDTVPFVNSYPSGNRVFVNRKTQADGKIMTVEYASKHLEELGFPDATEGARKLLWEALDPVVKELDQNFDKPVAKYDPMSLNYYLSQLRIELVGTEDQLC